MSFWVEIKDTENMADKHKNLKSPCNKNFPKIFIIYGWES